MDHSGTVSTLPAGMTGHRNGPGLRAGGFLLVPVLLAQLLGWLTSPGGVALAGYLGLLTTAVAYVLFGRGLAVLPAGPVTTLVVAEPLVATVLGVTLLNERLAAAGAAGAALVFAGLVVQGLSSARRPDYTTGSTAAATAQ